MKKLFLDEYTEQAAKDFADREAELKGFKHGGAEWQHCYKQHLGFAVGTMSVGRNPRRRNPRDVNTWKDIFGSDGFAGTVSQNFQGKGDRKPSLEEVQERIKSAVSTLAYMYINGIYGVRTSTKGNKSGKIDPENMSGLQMVDKGTADAEEINIKVAKNQLALTVIESALYEYLLPFFTMDAEDVKAVVDKGIKITGKVTPTGMVEWRNRLEAEIRETIGDRLKDLTIRKLLL